MSHGRWENEMKNTWENKFSTTFRSKWLYRCTWWDRIWLFIDTSAWASYMEYGGMLIESNFPWRANKSISNAPKASHISMWFSSSHSNFFVSFPSWERRVWTNLSISYVPLEWNRALCDWHAQLYRAHLETWRGDYLLDTFDVGQCPRQTSWTGVDIGSWQFPQNTTNTWVCGSQ